MIFFAGMVAVRADGGIVTLDALAVLALSGLALHYFPLEARFDLDTFTDYIFGVVDAGFGVVFSPFAELFDTGGWLFDHLRGDFRVVLAVGRGLIIAVPVLMVFVVLFASADAVFAGYVDSVWKFFQFPLDMTLLNQALFAGVIGWAACGSVAYGVTRRNRSPRTEEIGKPKAKLPTLGMIEAVIILGSVDLLFGLFVIIQFAYFFGGRATLAVKNLTYSDYARSGFFELVAVSVLTLGLVLLLDWFTVRHAQRHTRIFRVFAVILVALTGVILISASQRMLLYEDQFGFTMLRVYTHVFMYWLAVLFVFFLLALFRVRDRIFSLGVLLVLIGYLGTLNLMNVELYITERNIARAAEGYTVDFAYLDTFSVDAAPAMLRLYQSPDAAPEMRAEAGQWLAGKLIELDYLRQGSGSTLLSADLSRDTTWAALDAIRASLPQYVPHPDSYEYR